MSEGMSGMLDSHTLTVRCRLYVCTHTHISMELSHTHTLYMYIHMYACTKTVFTNVHVLTLYMMYYRSICT